MISKHKGFRIAGSLYGGFFPLGITCNVIKCQESINSHLSGLTVFYIGIVNNSTYIKVIMVDKVITKFTCFQGCIQIAFVLGNRVEFNQEADGISSCIFTVMSRLSGSPVITEIKATVLFLIPYQPISVLFAIGEPFGFINSMLFHYIPCTHHAFHTTGSNTHISFIITPGCFPIYIGICPRTYKATFLL